MPQFTANVSLLFRELPLAERFAAARAHGFTAVEVQFPYELDAHWLRAELQRLHLQLVLINVPAGDLMQGGDGLACVPGREAAFAEALAQALHYAEVLQVRCVNVLAGRQPLTHRRENCLEVLTRNVQLASRRLHELGVQTTCEAINTFDMPRFLLSSSADMQQLLSAVGHGNLAMQFDCYHLARMGEDVLAALSQHHAQIGHLQFADVPGRGEPGSGSLDFAALFAHIDTLGYRGYCGAEYLPTRPTAETLAWFAPYRSLP